MSRDMDRDVAPMLCQRRRRWSSIDPTPDPCIAFAGILSGPLSGRVMQRLDCEAAGEMLTIAARILIFIFSAFVKNAALKYVCIPYPCINCLCVPDLPPPFSPLLP